MIRQACGNRTSLNDMTFIKSRKGMNHIIETCSMQIKWLVVFVINNIVIEAHTIPNFFSQTSATDYGISLIKEMKYQPYVKDVLNDSA